MIVNYYGVVGCDCRWNENGAFLIAPSTASAPMLQQAGFYYAQDGSWYKQLSPQETQYLQSMSNQASVSFPPPAAGFTAPPVQEESPEDKKKAHNLCWISLILMYGLSAIRFVLAKIGAARLLLSASDSLDTIAGLTAIAAFIIMIIVRVKYPKNVFGKVLMIIYIVQIALAVLGFFLLAAMCGSALRNCRGY